MSQCVAKIQHAGIKRIHIMVDTKYQINYNLNMLVNEANSF